MAQESEVPREFVGLARDLWRRIDKTDKDAFAVIKRIEAIVKPRIARHKHTLRPEQQRECERIYRDVPDQFRLDGPWFTSPKNGLDIHEMRLHAMRRNLASWDAPGVKEPAIAVAVVDTKLHKRDGWSHGWDSIVSIGLHALGRRYQRDPDRSDAGMIEDIQTLLDGLDEMGKDQERLAKAASEGKTVEFPTIAGRWVGRFGTSTSHNFKTGEDVGKRRGALIIKTFLDPA